MEDSNRLFKILFSLGVIGAIVLLALAPVFAFDSFDLNYVQVYRTQGSSSVNQNDYWASSYSNINYFGVDFGCPVPDMADGDHYSVYVHSYFEVPVGDADLALALYIAPNNNTSAIYDQIGVQALGDTFSGIATARTRTGTFSWQGETGSFTILTTKCQKNSSYVSFSMTGVFDFNLWQDAVELEPIRLGFYIPNAIQDYYVNNIQWNIRTMDGQFNYDFNHEMLEIENLLTQIANQGGSSAVVSAVKSLQDHVDDFQSDFDTKFSNLNSVLQAMLYDYSPQETIDQIWHSQYDEFESKNEYLHDLEESLEGTIEDFTFPEVANQTAVGNVVGNFFANEFVIALTLAMMALMIVFLIL